MNPVTATGFAPYLLFCLLCLVGGCGKSVPTGCPKDLPIPDNVKVRGSSFDQKLFVLRLGTTHYEMDEIVELYRKSMKKQKWEIKSDSATDTNGGELEFIKGDDRKCAVFITHSSDSDKTIHVDITCDRQSGS